MWLLRTREQFTFFVQTREFLYTKNLCLFLSAFEIRETPCKVYA